MACIRDYLQWRGDLSFEQTALNELDAYILAKVGTPNYTGFVPSDEALISFPDLIASYKKEKGSIGNELGMLASKEIGPTIEKISKLPRYRDILLSGFVSIVDEDSTEQFSALTLKLPDGTNLITFRGTDDTIVAWKENFLLGLGTAVKAQLSALNYLKWAASAFEGPIIVAGHSKGGNLSVFASAMAPVDIQNRIMKIYNFDGPGFDPEFLASDGFNEIKTKLYTILPDYSIVGALLTQCNDIHYVKSLKSGVAAHDGFNWKVEVDHFVSCSGLRKANRIFNENLDGAFYRLSMEERKQLVSEIFDILSSTGAITVSDLAEHKMKSLVNMRKELKNASEIRKMAMTIVEQSVLDLTGIHF